MTKRWITASRKRGRIEDDCESELGTRCVCHGRSLVFYSKNVGKQPEYWLEESGSIWFLFYKNDSGSMQRIFSIARAGPRLFCFLHGSLEKMIRLKLCGTSAGSKSEYTGWWLDWTLNEVKVFISEIIAVKFSMLSFQFIIFFYNQILLSCEKHSQLKKCLLNE